MPLEMLWMDMLADLTAKNARVGSEQKLWEVVEKVWHKFYAPANVNDFLTTSLTVLKELLPTEASTSTNVSVNVIKYQNSWVNNIIPSKIREMKINKLNI